MKFLYLSFIAIIFFSCSNLNKVLKSTDPQYKLRMAEQYYAKKQYNQAQLVYEDVIPYFKGSQEFEDIYYKYAYTAYYQKDYLNAENLFKTFLEVFPNSKSAEEIQYMRAYTYYKQSPKPELDQSNSLKAIGLMQMFINTNPGSPRIKEASDIIDELRVKLEKKDFQAAQLYFDMGQFRAAAVAYNTLINTYPDSKLSDEYKFMAIKAYFRFAEMSIEEKKAERYEKVVDESYEFLDRFPESSYAKQVEQYLNQSQTNLKNITNESSATST
jgi:outer membrane protein assembly factor BamD